MTLDRAIERIRSLLAREAEPRLHLEDGGGQINPKYTMVAKMLVALLDEGDVRARLEAANLDDLRAILFVDTYLRLIQGPVFRQQIRELLADAAIPLRTIAMYAALSFAQEVMCEPGGPGIAGPEEVWYPIWEAARLMGREPEEVCRLILQDRLPAEVVVNAPELLHLIGSAEEAPP